MNIDEAIVKVKRRIIDASDYSEIVIVWKKDTEIMEALATEVEKLQETMKPLREQSKSFWRNQTTTCAADIHANVNPTHRAIRRSKR